MDKVGCTTPFQANKSQTCTDLQDAQKASKIFHEFRNNESLIELRCPRSESESIPRWKSQVFVVAKKDSWAEISQVCQVLVGQARLYIFGTYCWSGRIRWIIII